MTTAVAPSVDATAVKRPGLPFACSGGDVASPFESVVACPLPTKLAPAPVEPGTIAKLTVAPYTGLPPGSVTRACSGCPNRLFTAAVCVVTPTALSV